MAEVFGVISAGVSLVSATGQLIDGIMKLDSFCSQIKNIPDDIQTAVDDLSTMVEVLEFVQVEMGHESLPLQPSNLSSSMKVLSNLQQSTQQVGEVLEEMRMKLGKKRYWGRIKAVGMTKKLEKAAKRVENAQRMILILLAAENRMTFRQSFNAQRTELTAISARLFSFSSAGQLASKMLKDTDAVNNTENSNTKTEEPSLAGPAQYQALGRAAKAKGRNATSMRLVLPKVFQNSIWEFSVYKSNQGWDVSLRSYNIRSENAQIFEAILSGNLSQVCDLLQSGKASIWDLDPRGRGVLAFAASSCHDHGPAVLDYLVKSGADIYALDYEGFPPYHSFPRTEFSYVDEQQGRHLVAGYRVFMNHRDWIPPRPTVWVPWKDSLRTNDIIDMFPIFTNPPEEILRSILHEMWPPWETISPADRIETLFPEIGEKVSARGIHPLCIRLFLSRDCIQENFADWDARGKVELIKYAFEALAEQSVLGLENEVEEARLFLKDMLMSNSLINTLPEVDTLALFVSTHMWENCAQRQWRDRIGKCINFAQEGLKRYVSELVHLGIDIATAIDIEKKVLAIHKKASIPRGIYHHGQLFEFIAIDHGPQVNDWYLWLSNPLDEWAGEFWDMVDHPERAIPGAWEEDWLNA